MTLAYAPDRSPTGVAGALLALLDYDGNAGWTVSLDDGRRVALTPGTKLFASDVDAIAEARWQWRCNGGGAKQPRPMPDDVV